MKTRVLAPWKFDSAKVAHLRALVTDVHDFPGYIYTSDLSTEKQLNCAYYWLAGASAPDNGSFHTTRNITQAKKKSDTHLGKLGYYLL